MRLRKSEDDHRGSALPRRMRSLQPGPPPMRTRDGEERFGRKNLPQVLLDKVDGDTVLWMRMFLLYMVADEATVAKVGFLNEGPQDPESYVGGKDHGGGEGRERYPSYWAWDEWKKFNQGTVSIKTLRPREDQAYHDWYEHGDARAVGRCSRGGLRQGPDGDEPGGEEMGCLGARDEEGNSHGGAPWFEKTKEVNLWRVKSRRRGKSETIGYMAVYIDDMLVTGARRSVEAVLARIRETWDTSEPDLASATEDASGVKMHQQSYVTDLLDRHQIVKGGTLAGVGVPEEEDPPSPKDVHKAQVVTGELLNAARHHVPRSRHGSMDHKEASSYTISASVKVIMDLTTSSIVSGGGMRWSPTRTRPSEPTRTSLSPAWRCITLAALFSGLLRVRLALSQQGRK